MPQRSLGRLSSGRVFDTAYSKGTVHNGPLFVVRVLANGLDESRWGFAVGKRLAPKAVTRSRGRRRMREAARAVQVRAGFDIVVTMKASGLDATLERLVEGLDAACARAGCLEADE